MQGENIDGSGQPGRLHVISTSTQTKKEIERKEIFVERVKKYFLVKSASLTEVAKLSVKSEDFLKLLKEISKSY